MKGLVDYTKEEYMDRYVKLGIKPEISKVKQAIRINTLKIDEEVLKKRLNSIGVQLEKVKFLKYGYYSKAKFSLSSTTEYLLGYMYLQEASSQIPAEILAPKEGELVLDMAAAPGSKTTQLAQIMNNTGTIIALDTKPNRLVALRNNIERLGISNVIIYKKDARFAHEFNLKFDKILLDAPCSGNYCNDPKWFQRKHDYDNLITSQKELFKTALKCLKPKGTMVYSTCSLDPEENEKIIHWAIKHLGIKLLDIPLGNPGMTQVGIEKLHPEISKTRRIIPPNGQPFFLAHIQN